MSEVLNVFVKDYHELHVKFPDKWAFVYDLVPGDGLFDGGMVYRVANTCGECAKFLEGFRSTFGKEHKCTILPTSPIDGNGNLYFND